MNYINVSSISCCYMMRMVIRVIKIRCGILIA